MIRLRDIILSPLRTIRGKLAILTVILMGLISAFIFLFFPNRLEQQVVNSLVTKATSIAEVLAYSVRTPTDDHDRSEIDGILAAAVQFDEFVYAIVESTDDHLLATINRQPTRYPSRAEIDTPSGLSEDGALFRVHRPIYSRSRVVGTLHMAFSLDKLSDSIANTRAAIAGVSLLIFVFGLAGVYSISYIITEPLGKIVEAADQISDGQFDARVQVRGSDEIGRLAHSFNEMVDSLATAYTRLEGANTALARHSQDLQLEIGERQRAEQNLRDSEARFRAVIEQATDVIAVLDAQGVLTYISPASDHMMGRSPGELIGSHAFGYVHPDDREKIQRVILSDVEDPTRVFAVEARWKHANGRWCFLSLRGKNLFGQHGIEGTLVNISDITETKRFERELVIAKEKAEEMVRLKDSFLANMSHEIRTPLTGILGFAQVLRAEVDEGQRELVTYIEESGNRLLSTLNSVLDLAQLEANSMQLELVPVDIGAEVSNTVALLAPVARLNGLHFNINVPDEPVYSRADVNCLDRVITNLVSNAVKFTEQGGITVSIRSSRSDVVIEVADTGVGISAEFLPHLFDEFKQESTGLARSHEGSGLGLAITKRLVELMVGTISVESTKGDGTIFTITLPREYSAPRTAVPPSGDGASKPAPLRADRPPAGSHRASVLLVEDNPDTHKLIDRVLRDQYDIRHAMTPEEAISQARETLFDCILMDIGLGAGVNGVQVMNRIRRIDGYATRPVVAVTAFAMPGDHQRFIAEGFNDYLSKPFRHEQLLSILAKHIARPSSRNGASDGLPVGEVDH